MTLRKLHGVVVVSWFVFCILALGCWAQEASFAQAPAPGRILVGPRPSLLLLVRGPDLTAAISGPSRAIPGQDIALKITIFNKGALTALGTATGPSSKAYHVDIVFSSDDDIPMAAAIQPVYQGLTEEDFVEDMLMLGGRISNTKSIAAGKQTTYSLTTHIPAKTEHGIYYIAAVADPHLRVAESREHNNIGWYKIQIGARQTPGTRVPQGVDYWVMPYAVGDTTINNIKPNGLTDYTDSLSGLAMTNAPFGARLGLRHGHDGRIPTPTITYYRWTYRRKGAPRWAEFTAPVGVHYVKKKGGVITFPVYTLGPHTVNGMNLYEFRPHNAPSVPGAITEWPTTDWFGDIYSGFLNSTALADGKYDIRLEVFNSSGTKVLPSGSTFRFIVPTGVTPGGTILTTTGVPTAAGGFAFTVHIDNRGCGADIDAPAIGSTTVADECGFLLYDPAQPEADEAAKVRIGFHATHPDNRARFQFRIVRGIMNASSAGGEVSAASAGVYTGDGHGNFSHKFRRSELLGPKCPEKAAFSCNLHVYAKATNGWRHRLNGLDAHFVRAFALAPQ